MRRRPGALLPIERSILETGVELRLRGTERFHGFLIAKEMKEKEGARRLTAHGTLYRALDRMADAGWLDSEWEDPLVAANEGRPRRRLYKVTAGGETALAAAAPAPSRATKTQRGLAPS